MNRLEFFPDDVADPVWEAASGRMIPLEALPLHHDTREALRAWVRRWALLQDRTISAHAFGAGVSDRTPDPVSQEEWDAAERDGRDLFERLKRDLGPGWSVDWKVRVPPSVRK